ncbi:hypothetical protein K503DRAFT_296351 [Rhizopogon vinicolor AM-OR11-026]|uniref:MYND-type domain-containing protein n=1 Tax=Rhizopogon vinicolor AM-OR11-026 TaxID=1314800 RepID=A0A1B7MV27_9AGAM|nr:hypothetical protein K503DRAFT_296351 [Rhizopogon vinicolor AM-OR11-026]
MHNYITTDLGPICYHWQNPDPSCIMDDAPEYFDPAKWAAVLGLVPSSEPNLQIHDETERESEFLLRFYQHRTSGPAAKDPRWALVWAEFTAKYLHLLVDRFLDLPPPGARDRRDRASLLAYPIQNIYHATLEFTHTGYLAKFMSSSHAIAKGGKLLRVIAERLVAFAPNWKSLPDDEACIHRAVTTLMMLLTAAKDHPIPDEIKAKLVSWLETWAAYKSWSPESMGPYFDLPKTCFALSHMLRSNITSGSGKQRRRALQCIGVCGLPTCGIETNLKACARCKTVAYRSKTHQTEHWKHVDAPHKKYCFETRY